MKYLLVAIAALPGLAVASDQSNGWALTHHWLGFASLGIFFIAYGFVIFEEQLHMRKSKPVMLAAGLIWILIALVYGNLGYLVLPRSSGHLVKSG